MRRAAIPGIILHKAKPYGLPGMPAQVDRVGHITLIKFDS
ncbi:hypothetical protein VFA_003127 [Vibrio furnissii CIP 102972]|nr:hypothetical protein VFA_003127 [Vibrio furnissii CIP 102972]